MSIVSVGWWDLWGGGVFCGPMESMALAFWRESVRGREFGGSLVDCNWELGFV